MTMTSSGRATGEQEYADSAGTPPGGLVFAGMLMLLSGTMQALQGLVALVDDNFYVGKEYAFQLGLTTWGWIHLIGGVLVALAGAGMFTARTWARTLAVVLASLSILANFMWMPHYPLWSLTVIAFDVFVIWAATAHSRDVRPG
jgi:hypothetical protein